MAAPTIANSVTGTQNTNTTNVSADISAWSLAVGDLIVVIGTIDGNEAGNTAVTQSGFTEHYSVTSNSAITGCVYSKTLVSGDTSWTEIELTWTSNEKAVLRVLRFASGDHNGVGLSTGTLTNIGTTSVSLPFAFFFETDTLAIGVSHNNGNATVSVNPTGYTTDDETSATGGANCTQWVGTDVLTGLQGANAYTLSAAQDSVSGIFGVDPGAGGGSSVASFYYYE